MLRVYREKLTGPVPAFPDQMEQNINNYLKGEPVEGVSLPTTQKAPDFSGMNAPSATGCRISILRLFEPKVDFGAATPVGGTPPVHL